MKSGDLLSISKSDSGRMGAPEGYAKAKCYGPGRPTELMRRMKEPEAQGRWGCPLL